MIFRALSALMVVLAAWSAYLQLNDPDPERWAAMYLACAAVALLSALAQPAPRFALSVAVIAIVWAVTILPELLGKWRPADLTAKMVAERPEIEFGREFFGLAIVAAYCLAAFAMARRRA